MIADTSLCLTIVAIVATVAIVTNVIIRITVTVTVTVITVIIIIVPHKVEGGSWCIIIGRWGGIAIPSQYSKDWHDCYCLVVAVDSTVVGLGS